MAKKPGPKPGVKFSDLPKPEFGKRLATLRKERGLTQEKLARKMGVSKRAVGYYESQMENPSLETVTRLASALGVSKERILGLNGESFRKTTITPSRSLQQAWPLAAKLSLDDQRFIADTIRRLTKKNSTTT